MFWWRRPKTVAGKGSRGVPGKGYATAELYGGAGTSRAVGSGAAAEIEGGGIVEATGSPARRREESVATERWELGDTGRVLYMEHRRGADQ